MIAPQRKRGKGFPCPPNAKKHSIPPVMLEYCARIRNIKPVCQGLAESPLMPLWSVEVRIGRSELARLHGPKVFWTYSAHGAMLCPIPLAKHCGNESVGRCEHCAFAKKNLSYLSNALLILRCKFKYSQAEVQHATYAGTQPYCVLLGVRAPDCLYIRRSFSM